MGWIRSFLLAIIALPFLVSASFAVGSGAYRLEVPDAGVAGKGSAFVGEANRASAVYYNPAGLTQMEGQSVAVGLSLIQPKIHYENNASTIQTKMQQESFLLPSMYYVTNLGSENLALGIGTLSSWGLVTDWAPDSFARYTTTRAEVSTQDYLITGAYKVNDQFSVGVGLVVNDASVDKQKKIYQATGDGNFRLRGESTSAGFVVSGLYKLNERHQFGLVYRSAIQHKYKGHVYLDDLNTTNVIDLNADSVPDTNYNAVFGGPSYHTDVISKSTLPDNIVLGYSYKPNAKWTFNADVEWMNWSVVNEEELAYPAETNAVRLAVLNDGNPASRDWQSVLSGALGAQYEMSDRFRLRSGYYYRQSPIPGDTWEPNLPDGDSHAVTLGFGYDLRKNLTVDLAWSGIYCKPRVIDNTVGDAASGGTTVIDGTYYQWDNLAYATVTYSF